MKTVFKKIINFFKRLFEAGEIIKEMIDDQKEERKESRKEKIKAAREEYERAIYLASNKGKRNIWLSSKGYTPREVEKSEKQKTIILSSYARNVLAFKKLKLKNEIRIFKETKQRIGQVIDKNKRTLQINKQGVPFYPIKKAAVLAID